MSETISLMHNTFQSTLPARGATSASTAGDGHTSRFQSTLPARGATGTISTGGKVVAISIHAPRTGSDLHVQAVTGAGRLSFQSTLPARGATFYQNSMPDNSFYFNPRSPHGERLLHEAPRAHQWSISIHAPRTGSDGKGPKKDQKNLDFNPRSPHGERRHLRRVWAYRDQHFNPRSPHGERRIYTHDDGTIVVISIHAPRTGSDSQRIKSHTAQQSFQSTLPARGATSADGHGSR